MMPETADGGWLLDDTPFVYTEDGEPPENEERDAKAKAEKQKNG